MECGVWKGGAVGMMALASDRTRRLHLFDSFTEICEPDAVLDGAQALAEVGQANAEGRLRPVAGIYDAVGGPGTIDACRDLIERRIGYPSDLIQLP